MFHYDYPVNWGEPVVSCHDTSMMYNDKKEGNQMDGRQSDITHSTEETG